RLLELAAWHPGRILLIFDGLDALQDTPGERALGLLRDSSLRHLARGLAQGAPGVRLLLTSRAAPPELAAAPCFRELPVAGLPAASARRLLGRRGVRGSPAELDRLATAAGSALELDLLGGLLGACFAGDPAAIERLPPAQSLLGRIGAFHVATLPQAERAVITMLSVAGDPVPLDSFVSMLKTHPHQQNQAALMLEETAIIQAIATLRRLRIITACDDQPPRLSLSHPAIAGDLAPLNLTGQNDLRAKVSGAVLSSLMTTTDNYQRQALGERLVMHLLAGGHTGFAFSCYAGNYGLDYIPLAWGAAGYRRGLRVTSALVAAGGIDLENNRNTRPWLHRALYLLDLGRPAEAESQLRQLLDSYRAWSDEMQVLRRRMNELNAEDDADEMARIHERLYRRPSPSGDKLTWLYYEAPLLQCLGDALFAQGRLPEAEALADEVIGGAEPDFWRTARYPLRDTGANPFGRRALARAMRGDAESALEDFEAAAEFDRRLQDGALRPGGPGGAYYVAHHALLLARLGKPRTARRLLGGAA
ncbi:MAG TPA: hypothetical protein VGE07_10970, partial [Herpetosiphonaceae bacterium]